MKKLLLAGLATAAIFASTTSAFADVVRPDGQTTGKPVMSESNTGSAQGVANRSATGTTMKATNDGTNIIWR